MALYRKSALSYLNMLTSTMDGDERYRLFQSQVPQEHKSIVKKLLELHQERLLFNRRMAPPPPTSLDQLAWGGIEWW